MKKVKLIVYPAIALVALFYWLVACNNLNPLYLEGALFWAVLITAYAVVYCLFRFGEVSFHPNTEKQAQIPFRYVPKERVPKLAKLLIALPWAVILVVYVGSSFLFHYKAYRDQLGTPQVKEFTSDVQVVDLSQLPIVDRDLALKLADKKLGERTSLGSQAVLGEPTIQMVDGELIWAVPLHHSGFFKWLTNMEGTPGYITVSATNTNDVQYVEGYPVKYQPNGYLFDNLNRYIRTFTAPFVGVTDYSFELDDTGRPYWVVTTYRNLRGFNLPEANGAILIDAATGEHQRYSIDEVPEWVDRVQPEDFLRTQIANQGEFVHGYLNFSNRDKFRPSEGETVIYNNGNCYYFTGLTSVGNDDSAIGFMMVDMVTKEVSHYKMAGATERAAQNSAMGKVQHLGYDASFPIIINVDNLPTYFMTLKDNEGLIKQYAFVNVENYSVVGNGETISAALDSYRQGLANEELGSAGATADPEEQVEVQGTVLRIASEIMDGETSYKMLLEEYPDRIYTLSAALSEELALTQPGDRVTLMAGDTQPVARASEFDNLTIGASQEDAAA